MFNSLQEHLIESVLKAELTSYSNVTLLKVSSVTNQSNKFERITSYSKNNKNETYYCKSLNVLTI